MISLLWTKSSLPLSKAIRWATKDDCSHFAICFDKRIVFHSNLKGVHIDWLTCFASHCDIIHSIQLPVLSLEQEEIIYQKAISISHRGYDIRGLFYFGYRLMLLKYFGKPLPKENKWGSSDLMMCIETFPVLDVVIPTPDTLSMMTPDQLHNYTETYLKVVQNGNIPQA